MIENQEDTRLINYKEQKKKCSIQLFASLIKFSDGLPPYGLKAQKLLAQSITLGISAFCLNS